MVSQVSVAYQQIKSMIFHMQLLPGTRIPESMICEKLSISRTPIRDALRALASEGLVTIELNRGATVKDFSDDEVRKIGEIRLAQDILSAHLASYFGSVADFTRLEHLADLCEAAASKCDVYLRIQADIDFHIAIAQISRNEHLLRQQNSIYQLSHLIHISKYTDIPQSLIQISHHKPIIAAIRAGNFPTICSLVGQHIKDFYQLDPYLLVDSPPLEHHTN